jgi:hypothetical protein
MKILITAHTADEHGQHVPGDVVELGDEEARAYIEKGWALETDQEASTKAERETATLK